jgi:carbon-monoxide dehydrogenase medium subunit
LKPPRFEYADPTTVDAALELLAEHGDDAKVLAGGQSLMPLLNMRLARPRVVVDVNRIPGLDHIRRSDGELALGALARHHDVAVSPDVAEACPLLTRSLAYVGHPAIRYRGTVCGSLAHADPAAELPAVATALGATMVARSARGTRTIASGDFFRTWFTTALEPDELLVEVRLPVQARGAGSAFLEVARRHGGFAQIGIAGTVRHDGGVLRDVSLVAFAAGPGPVRLAGAEAALEGRTAEGEALEEAAAAASGEIDPGSDVHSSAGYKRSVLRAIRRRAVRAAAEESKSHVEAGA